MPIEAQSGALAQFLNLGFSTLTMAEVIEAITARREKPIGFIATPNVDHVVRLARAENRGLDRVYGQAMLRLCDSRILALLARIGGERLEVVPGSDLTARLLDGAIRPGDRVAIIGGNAATLAKLRVLYPELEIAHHIPPMGLATDHEAQDAAIAFVEESGAHFTFLAVGAPQSEIVAAKLAERGRAIGTALCIGASIEFLTGEKQRAPEWMQGLSLEWLHRLVSEPQRLWKRYLIEGPAIFRIAARWKLTGKTPWSILPTVGSDPRRFGLADEPEVDRQLPKDIERQAQ